MTWILFAILHIITNATSNILRKVVMKDDKSDPVASGIVFQLLSALLFFIIAIVHGFVMPPVIELWGNFVFSGICYALGTVCIFKALKYIEASEATIVSAMDAVVTIIASIIFLGEHFNLQRVVGTFFIIFSIVLISYKKKLVMNRGVFYALGMAVFYGLGVTNDAYLIRYVEPFSFLSIGFLLPGLFLIVMQPKAVKKIPYFFDKKNFTTMFLFSFLYVVAAIGFYFALKTGAQASQLAPVAQSSVILTIFLSAIFLKEKDHFLLKVILSLCTAFGVTLLA